jgi:hypothetical protein
VRRIGPGAVVGFASLAAFVTYAVTGWQIVGLWWFVVCVLAVPFTLFRRSRD